MITLGLPSRFKRSQGSHVDGFLFSTTQILNLGRAGLTLLAGLHARKTLGRVSCGVHQGTPGSQRNGGWDEHSPLVDGIDV